MISNQVNEWSKLKCLENFPFVRVFTLELYQCKSKGHGKCTHLPYSMNNFRVRSCSVAMLISAYKQFILLVKYKPEGHVLLVFLSNLWTVCKTTYACVQHFLQIILRNFHPLPHSGFFTPKRPRLCVMKLTGVMMFLKAGVEKEKSTYNTFILSHIDSTRRTYPF